MLSSHEVTNENRNDMKRLFATICLTASVLLQATAAHDVLRITHRGITDYARLSAIDSLYFEDDGKTLCIQPLGEALPVRLASDEICSLDYIVEADCPSAVYVTYADQQAMVENPFLLAGVTVSIDGAYVTVSNPDVTTEYTTRLTGSTRDGGFCYVGSYKTTVVLDGLSLASQRGAAVDIQCGKRVALELKKGTVNTLSDAADGQQKAALYCKGHLEIDKAGQLDVTGNTAHAISAKEYILLKKSTGQINVLGAKNDGIHCRQFFAAKGFAVTIQNTGGDGIQAEAEDLDEGETYAEDYENGSIQILDGEFTITTTTDGGMASGDTYSYNCLKADKAVCIAGGKLTLTNTGTMSKSVKAGNADYEGTVTVSGGELTCNASGDKYGSGSQVSYCAAIKTDYYYGTGGIVTLNASAGTAVRGISADQLIDISEGTYLISNSSNGLVDTSQAYSAKCITCDQNVVIRGGTLTLKATGSGGKCLKADGTLTLGTADGNGPVLVASTTGARLGSSGGGGGGWGGGGWGGGGGGHQSGVHASAKALKAVGQVIVYGGNLTVTTATDGAEGLESKTSIQIKGGCHYLKCYDDCINSAGIIEFAGGSTVCYATRNDAVDSNYGRSGAITISGGNVFAYSSAGSPEEGFDCDNNSYIKITGGIAVSAGGSQGGGGWGGGSQNNSVGSSTQGYYLGSSPSSYNSTYYYTLCNTQGEPMCTYKFEGSVSNSLSLLTAPNLGKGTITVKQGTAAPTACSQQVCSAQGNGVFFVAPTVTTTGTAATITAK